MVVPMYVEINHSQKLVDYLHVQADKIFVFVSSEDSDETHSIVYFSNIDIHVLS